METVYIELRHGTLKIDLDDWEKWKHVSWNTTDMKGRLYVVCSTYKRFGLSSQLLQKVLMNPPKGLFIFYKNGDSLDLRKENLKLVTRSYRNHNRKKFTRNKNGADSSIYRGVCREDGYKLPWRAHFRGDRLGRFATQEEAAKKYDEAALAYYGEEAHLNFPLENQ